MADLRASDADRGTQIVASGVGPLAIRGTFAELED
jgi:hypothetical protein